jgi:Amt family ammonium transporter
MSNDDFWPILAASLAWLVPIGFTLIAAASVPTERAWQTALAGVAGAGLAVLAFFLVGFGLAYGGIGLAHDAVAGYNGLIWEWSLLGSEWGPSWGMAGLAGWALTGPATTADAYALFVANLPWVTMATLVPLLALRGRTPAAVSLLSGLLVGGVLYPLAINWLWGGGWLANLGVNLNLGHGAVDFAGAGAVHLVGGAVGLAGLLTLLPRRPRHLGQATTPAPLPPAHLPLLAAAGALFILAGSLGWQWANPLLNPDALLPMRGMANTILAAAGGTLAPLAYTWFVTGRGDPLFAAKGLAAALIAGLAIGPFTPPWAALALGAVVGLLTPLLSYLVNEILRIADDTSVVAVHLLGAVAGLLTVGLLADGVAGAGWNGIGATAHLGVSGQGVAGAITAVGFLADWPGQMQAQLVALVALFLIPFLVATVVFGLIAMAMRLATRPSAPTPASHRETSGVAAAPGTSEAAPASPAVDTVD